jgi:hypothetical protein
LLIGIPPNPGRTRLYSRSFLPDAIAFFISICKISVTVALG